MSFSGYLIKIGGASGTSLPLSYIRENSYSETPNQRIDRNSKRNNNGVLNRKVVSHMPSKIKFTTMPMTNSELTTLMNIIKANWIESQRKVRLQYYNRESDSYKEGWFYMPDLTYTIRTINGNTVYYEGIEFTFIEY